MSQFTSIKHWFAKHESKVYIALDIPMFAVTYGYLVLLGRQLSGHEFGLFNTSLALFSLLTAVGVSLQAVIARRVAASKGRVGLREFWVLGGTLAAITAAATGPWVAHRFVGLGIRESGSDLFAASLFLHLAISLLRGVLQGRERFVSLWAAQASEHLTRVFGLFVLGAGPDLREIWWTVIAGNVLHISVAALFLGREEWSRFAKPSNAAVPIGPEVVRVLLANAALSYFLSYDVLFAGPMLGASAPTYITASKIGRIGYFVGASAAVVLLPRFAKPSATGGTTEVRGVILAAVAGAVISPILGTLGHPFVAFFFPAEIVPSVGLLTTLLFANIGLATCQVLLTWHLASGNNAAVIALGSTGVLATLATWSGARDMVFFALSYALFAWILAIILALLGLRWAQHVHADGPQAIHTFYGTPVPVPRRPTAPGPPPKKALIRGEWLGTLAVVLFAMPWLSAGQVTFSDLAFAQSSERYLDNVVGLYNHTLGTPNWFNLPRVFFVLPAYVISGLANFNGTLFLAVLLGGILCTGVWCFGKLFRVVSGNHQPSEWESELLLAAVSTLFVVNPWVITRIQHIFLLCGYCLIPGIIALAWTCWGPGAWRDGSGAFHRTFSKAEVRYFLLLGMLISASFAGVHFGFLGVFVVGATALGAAAYTFWLAWRAKHLRHWAIWFISRTVATVATVLLFGALWMVPFLQSLASGVRPSQNNVNTYETVVMFSRNSDILSVAAGASYWWPMFDVSSLGPIFWSGATILIGIAIVGVVHPVGRWSAVLCGVAWVFTTGTHYELFAPTYLKLVFESQYPLGDMLRDPNKIYGASLILLGINIGLGVNALAKWRPRFGRVALLATALAWVAWCLPYYDVYMLGYYRPIAWPSAYEAMTAKLHRLPPESKVLYLPLADHMVSDADGFAHPNFNEVSIGGRKTPKATGDHMVFNSPTATVFPYEGNDTKVGYVLRLLRDRLDLGDTRGAIALARAFGVTHIVFRTDHAEFATELKSIERSLDQSDELTLAARHEFISLYEVHSPVHEADQVPNVTLAAGGLNRLLWFREFYAGDLLERSGVVQWDVPRNDPISLLQPGDLIEIPSLDEFLLLTLRDRWIFPADTLLRSNPRHGWGKVALSGMEWARFLKANGMQDTAYELEFSHSVALTTAPKTLRVPPYTSWSTLGNDILPPVAHDRVETSKDENGRNLLFLANDFPKLESQVFPVRADAAYALRATFDPGIRDAEVRLRLFDAAGRDLGTEFVSPSKPLLWSAERRDEIVFVPPPAVTHAKLEVELESADPKPREIRGIQLRELLQATERNDLRVRLPESPPGPGQIWIRALCSPHGGALQIHADENHLANIDTGCRWFGFRWQAVPSAAAPTEISISNVTGFQAVQAIAWVSDQEWDSLRQRSGEALQNLHTMTLVDASEESAPLGVLGVAPGAVDANTVFGPDLEVKFSLDILKDAVYEIEPKAIFPGPSDTLHMQLRGAGHEHLREWSGASAPLSMRLDRGQYEVLLKWTSTARALVSTADLRGGATSSEEPSQRTVELPENIDTWGLLSSEAAPLSTRGPVQLRFHYTSENCRTLHGKLQYYDAERGLLDSQYLEISEKNSPSGAFSLEIQPPAEAKFVSVQFLAKRGLLAQAESWYRIRDFGLWEKNNTPGFDSLGVREVKPTETESTPRGVVHLAPIPFWSATGPDGRVLRSFPMNGVAMGIDSPPPADTLQMNVRYNTSWWAGIIAVFLGVGGILVLSPRANKEPQDEPSKD